MTGANMPTKYFFKALSFEKLCKFDNENLLVGHRLITNPFYTVNVALVQVILTKNYRVLINTLVYNNTVIYSLFPWSMQSAYMWNNLP
jgi:hypothetical protein